MANKLEIEIDLDTGVISKKLKELKPKMEKSGKKAGKSFGESFGASASTAVGTAVGLIAAKALQAVTDVLSNSVQNFKEFNTAIAEINSILPENAQLTARTTTELNRLSASFGTTAQSQAKAFYSIVSAGVKGTSKQLETLAAANEAAVAGLVDINTSAFALVSSVNAYAQSGLTATEASDILFTAVKEGQTTFSELAASIGSVTSIASSAGIEFSEVAGTLAFLTKSGISTDRSVTALRGIISSILKPSTDAAKFAKQLGIEFNQAALEAKGLAQFLSDVGKATNGSTTQLTRLFPNVEALAGVLPIVNGNFKDFKRILDQTSNSAGATATASGKLKNTLNFKLEQLSSEFRNLSTSIVEFFNPAITFATDKLISFFKFARTQTTAATTRELNRLNREIEKVTESITQIQEEGTGFLDKLFGVDRSEKLDQLNEQLLRLKELRSELIEQNQFGPEPIETTDQEEEKDPIVDKTEERAEALATLGQAFRGLSKQITESTDLAEKGLSNIEKAARALANSIKTGFGRALASGFAGFGAALVQGENALDAFAKSFLSTLGQMMVQQGATFILQGLGFQLIPGLQANGSALIGVGAALSTLGGALTAIGGNIGTPSSTGAGGGSPIQQGSQVIDNELPTAEERAEPETRIQVNIQGDVLDSEESGLRIVQLINDAFDKDGAIVTA